MRDLNFFSQYQEKKQEKKNEKIYFYLASGLLVSIIIGTVSFNLVKIMIYDKQIKEYTEKFNANDIQTKLKEADEVSGKLSILTKYESALSSVSTSLRKLDVVTDDLLNDICGAIPSEVSFKDFKVEGYDVTISGISSNREAIGEYEHNLKKLSKIKSVQITKISKTNTVGEDYSFDMTCVLKEVE
ncbi:PilN domain-containing protein [Clostridium sp. SHJSY1]|uniref:PilN domain-containing protein n=1 Tax=Clostridium sp. SHJSY1 TaxID=2942483 RepID=UPI0028760D7C|nr:PilN domain-containing protein [Clostridium sp. SHJSY1]MDS0525688.1 PilN domain-containing protein [Clostridium sp. SHJSY1]